MAYIKTNWVDDVTPLSSSNMNNIEDGLVEHIEDNTKHVYEEISEIILNGAISQIDFSNIPTGYKYFKLIFEARNNVSSTTHLELILNDDVSGNYNRQNIVAANVAMATAGTVSSNSIQLQNSLPSSSFNFSYGFLDISNSNPLNTKRINGEWYSETGTSSTQLYKAILGGAWINTIAEINKITLRGVSSSVIGVGSRFVLWGCK